MLRSSRPTFAGLTGLRVPADQGGSHHHQLTCGTVHPSISAPLPVLMLLDPPRAHSSRHYFSFSGVFVFRETRQKFDITIFAFTHSYYYLPLLVFVFACHRQRMEGVAFPEPLPTLDGLDLSPLSAFFSPILLSAAFTITFHHICGRGPSWASLRFPTLIYDLFFFFYLPSSTYLPYPLIFSSISLSCSFFCFTKIFIIASGHTKMMIYKME